MADADDDQPNAVEEGNVAGVIATDEINIGVVGSTLFEKLLRSPKLRVCINRKDTVYSASKVGDE